MHAKPPEQVLKRVNLARRLLTGAVWAFSVRCLGAVGALAANAYLARMLTPEQLGWFFLLQSIVVFIAIIARFGLKQTIVSFVAASLARNQPGRARHALKIVCGIIATGTTIVSGFYYFFVSDWLANSIFNAPAIVSVAGITVAWIAFLAFQTPIAETFRGLHDIRLATLLDGAFANVLLALFLMALWAIDLRLSFLEAVMVATGVVGLNLLCGSILLASRCRVFHGTGTASIREILSMSTPLFVTDIANQVMASLSLWIVGSFLVADSVALYGAAWKLVLLVLLPLTLVNMTVQPVIAELHENGEKGRLENALRGMATLAGVPAAGVLAIFMFWGADVLDLVYGSHYRDASLILAILSIGMLVDVWSGSCAQVLAYTGHQKQLMYISVATGLVSAILAVFGAKLADTIGVATAVAAGKILQNTAIWLLVHRLTGLWTHVTLRPAFILSAAKRLRR